MVTTENYNFAIYSIMLTTEKMRKMKIKVSQEIEIGHFKNVQNGKSQNTFPTPKKPPAR